MATRNPKAGAGRGFLDAGAFIGTDPENYFRIAVIQEQSTK
jgi:hypothetical protein